MAKYLVKDIQLKQAVSLFGKLGQYFATGEGWAGWSIYVDTNAREFVVSFRKEDPVCVPFESVSLYRRGIVAPKEAVTSGWAKMDDE